MDKTARLEVAIYMLEERIKSLEGSLREIRDIALASEGVEFYAMLADKALKEKNQRTGPGTEDPDERFEVIFNQEMSEFDKMFNRKKNERDPQP